MHFKIFKMITTRGFLTAVECIKSIFGRGSAPDPLGELTTLPQTPSRLRRGHPSPFPTSSTRSASRFRRLRRLVPKTPSEIFFWIRPCCRALWRSVFPITCTATDNRTQHNAGKTQTQRTQSNWQCVKKKH